MPEEKLYKIHLSGEFKEFEFNGKTYKSGDSFETDDPFEAVAFDVASNEHGIARKDDTLNFWKNVYKRCSPIEVSAEPSDASSTPAIESNPNTFGGDTAKKQGAPDVSSGRTLSGHETYLKKDPPVGP